MAFTNIPPSLHETVSSIDDRVAKLESGPNYGGATADTATTTANTASSNANTALTTANTALANAATAYAAAIASLQPNASTIVNASNQMTGINGNGITMYASASGSTTVPTSGARVIFNSAGLVGFSAASTSSSTGITFALSASTGTLNLTGPLITNGSITGTTMNIAGNFIVDASGLLTCTGATVTGAITSSSYTSANTSTGAAVSIPSSNNVINFYPATRTNFLAPAYINTGGNATNSYLQLFPSTYTTQSSSLTPYLVINASTTTANNVFQFQQAPIQLVPSAWSYTGSTGSPTSGKFAYIAQDGTVINSAIGFYYSGGSTAPANTQGDNGDYWFGT